MLIVYQEPMILKWAKVVTVISLTINSRDNSDEDYRPGPQDEEEGYGSVSAQQDQMGGAHVGSMAHTRGVEYGTSFQFLTKLRNLNLSTSVAPLKQFFSTTRAH
jgi:hypothetical protein